MQQHPGELHFLHAIAIIVVLVPRRPASREFQLNIVNASTRCVPPWAFRYGCRKGSGKLVNGNSYIFMKIVNGMAIALQ